MLCYLHMKTKKKHLQQVLERLVARIGVFKFEYDKNTYNVRVIANVPLELPKIRQKEDDYVEVKAQRQSTP